MSENGMWNQLRPFMKREGFDPVRVETRDADGIPDVNYKEGWIELKFARTWPMRGGALKIEHYTQQQRTWGFRRQHAGGRSFLLLKAHHDWMLFDGFTAFHHVGKENRETLSRLALLHYSGKVGGVVKEMSPWLTGNIGALSRGQLCRWMRVMNLKTPEQVAKEIPDWDGNEAATWDTEKVLRHETDVQTGLPNELEQYWKLYERRN